MSHNSIQSKASIATPYFSGPYPTGAIEDRNFEVGFNGEFITNMLAPRIQEDSDQWRRGGNMIYCWYVSLPIDFRFTSG